ncbi:putative integral membrane protein (TIGR00698 family) [Psychrobacter immobilis]|uniref:Putative integral membrane protein (TIGR00698 family) n=1 Tax=Psychrobacter immobilis TaxID=498 RepID=A0A2V1ZN58_PSYIM|nr:YeiH family putative sulfate export transporter [Psychrobacter immobilis]PWK08893.1 putative integral membrane protein (TIGR00698 family) [Psychrobacter immobilis]
MYALTQSVNNYLPRSRHLAGLIVVLIGSLFCLWLNTSVNTWTNGRIVGLSSLTLAILLGMVLGNTVYPSLAERLSVGVAFAKGQILRLAIMFYGFKLTLTQVSSVGLSAVMSDALVLTSTFLLTYWIGTRWLKVDKQTTLLIGSGASICGAAAVIAAEPVVKAEAHKVTIAVATVVVFGTVAMLLYPFLYHLGWLQPWLNAQQYGIYTGSTIHEVAQVVVAGNAVSPEVGDTAVVTKMIRVMMLAPFLLILSFALTKGSSDNGKKPSFINRIQQVKVPWFAFIFIAIVLLHTWVPMSASFERSMVMLDDVLLTMAMFALGLTTHLGAIKQAGVKPLILGAIMFAWLIVGGGLINIGISFL